jgi:hypothetical protein
MWSFIIWLLASKKVEQGRDGLREEERAEEKRDGHDPIPPRDAGPRPLEPPEHLRPEIVFELAIGRTTKGTLQQLLQ